MSFVEADLANDLVSELTPPELRDLRRLAGFMVPERGIVCRRAMAIFAESRAPAAINACAGAPCCRWLARLRRDRAR